MYYYIPSYYVPSAYDTESAPGNLQSPIFILFYMLENKTRSLVFIRENFFYSKIWFYNKAITKLLQRHLIITTPKFTPQLLHLTIMPKFTLQLHLSKISL